MTDPLHILKLDPVGSIVALAALPAPLVIPTLDDAAKVAALVYAVIGTIYLLRQLFK